MSYQFANNTEVLGANLHLIRPRECVHDALYLVGELPANYPMPAIVYRAKMDMSYKPSYYVFSYSQSIIGRLVRVLKTQ